MTERKMDPGRSGALKIWGIVLLVVLGIILLAARGRMKREPERGTQSEKAISVRAVRIEPRTVTDAITIPGKVEPAQRSRLAAERGGKIVEVLVEKGAKVKKGQVLARLDKRLWESQRKQAEIQKREAEKDLSRWKALKKTGAVSEREYDAIQSRLDLAKASLEATEVTISQCEVRSPFAGVVDEQYAELGEFAPEGGLLFYLVNTDTVKITAQVPERDVLSVKVGQEVVCEISASDQVVTGSVAFVAEQADSMSNSFEIEIRAANSAHRMKAGMIAKISIVRGVFDDAVALTLATIVPQRGDHVVFVVQGDRAERRIVRIDRKLGHEAIIAHGVELGESVIIEGHRSLQDGALIQVVE